jgi:hypothetical protein
MGEADEQPIPETLHCPNCGYNLRGLTARQCPECGEGFDLQALRRPANQPVLSPWLEMPLMALGLSLAYPLTCCVSGFVLAALDDADIWFPLALGGATVPILLANVVHGMRLAELQLNHLSRVPRRSQTALSKVLWTAGFAGLEFVLTLAGLMLVTALVGLVGYLLGLLAG